VIVLEERRWGLEMGVWVEFEGFELKGSMEIERRISEAIESEEGDGKCCFCGDDKYSTSFFFHLISFSIDW